MFLERLAGTHRTGEEMLALCAWAEGAGHRRLNSTSRLVITDLSCAHGKITVLPTWAPFAESGGDNRSATKLEDKCHQPFLLSLCQSPWPTTSLRILPAPVWILTLLGKDAVDGPDVRVGTALADIMAKQA